MTGTTARGHLAAPDTERGLLLPPVYLSAISFTVGERVPVENLAELDPSRLATARREGIAGCLVDSRSTIELAVACARSSLAVAPQPPVHAVYATDSPYELSQTEDGFDFLRRCDLVNTDLVTVGGGGCGNLGPGLAVARGLLWSRAPGPVLFVTTDRVMTGNRFTPNGMTLLSDGAASFLLSTELVAPGFRVLSVASSVRAGMAARAGIAAARQIAAAVGEAAQRALESAELGAACRYLLLPNYGVTSRALFSMAAGFDVDTTYPPSNTYVGHCFSADALISLSQLMSDGVLDRGDRLMLLAASPQSWSIVIVEYVEPARSDGSASRPVEYAGGSGTSGA